MESYFTGLSGLSKVNLAYANTSALYSRLTTGSFAAFEITEAEGKAYGGLTNLLLQGATDLYRGRKLKTAVRSANPDLQTILRKWGEIEGQDKVGLLEFKMERVYVQYQSLLREPGLSAYEKQKAATEYYRWKNENDLAQKQIRVFSKTLNSMARGHQDIADHIDRLSSADLKKSIAIYLSEIRQLSKNFNRIQ